MFRSLCLGHCVWVAVLGLLYFGRLHSGFSNHLELHWCPRCERYEMESPLQINEDVWNESLNQLKQERWLRDNPRGNNEWPTLSNSASKRMVQIK